jgi:hypothetical protein
VTAAISPCGRYRYRLTRGDGNRLCFVMLNPSTADANINDPTIRRCRSFARREGYAGIEVLNLFALRATDPAQLIGHGDPTGPENVAYLEQASLVHGNGIIVCAWGAHRAATPDKVNTTIYWLRRCGARLVCLGKTKSGAPRHPLYVHGDTPFEDFP